MKVALVAGLQNQGIKTKLLNALHINDTMTVKEIKGFVRQAELVIGLHRILNRMVTTFKYP